MSPQSNASSERSTSLLKRVLHEPLLHFVVIGALVFGAYALISESDEPGAGEIVVQAGQIEHLATTFAMVWQRPPTRDELRDLVQEHIVEEALYREAIKIGLDEDDTIIRRRLRQKMEFVIEDVGSLAEFSDDELQAFLDAEPERFALKPSFTFQHVFFSQDRGDSLDAAVADALEQLAAGADPAQLGDRLLLPGAFDDEPWRSVAAQFGDEFAEALRAAPVEQWWGPAASAYGVHVVFVAGRSEARTPGLEEIRSDVKRELRLVRREAAHAAVLDQILAGYEVTIQWPDGVQAP